MQFFTEFFTEEHPSFTRLETLRSCLSILFESRRDNPLRSPLLRRLFSSFLEKNPPKRRRVEAWDPTPVLAFLSRLECEKIDFMTLSMKTAVLVALATGARQSEIHAIHLDYIRKTQSSWICDLQCIPKTFKKGNLDPALFKMEILINVDDPNLCPVRHLEQYISTTAHLRNTRYLFISTLAPFDRISSQRLSKWIRMMIARGLNKEDDLMLQSTRSVVSSDLFSKGIPVDQIMAKCHWKHSSSFYQHYHKRNPNQSVSSFRKQHEDLHVIVKSNLPQAASPSPVSILNQFSQSQEMAVPSTSRDPAPSSSSTLVWDAAMNSYHESVYPSQEFVLDSSSDSDSSSYKEPYMSPLMRGIPDHLWEPPVSQDKASSDECLSISFDEDVLFADFSPPQSPVLSEEPPTDDVIPASPPPAQSPVYISTTDIAEAADLLLDQDPAFFDLQHFVQDFIDSTETKEEEGLSSLFLEDPSDLSIQSQVTIGEVPDYPEIPLNRSDPHYEHDPEDVQPLASELLHLVPPEDQQSFSLATDHDYCNFHGIILFPPPLFPVFPPPFHKFFRKTMNVATGSAKPFARSYIRPVYIHQLPSSLFLRYCGLWLKNYTSLAIKKSHHCLQFVAKNVHTLALQREYNKFHEKYFFCVRFLGQLVEL